MTVLSVPPLPATPPQARVDLAAILTALAADRTRATIFLPAGDIEPGSVATVDCDIVALDRRSGRVVTRTGRGGLTATDLSDVVAVHVDRALVWPEPTCRDCGADSHLDGAPTCPREVL